jgi:hypothetical protein
MSAYPHVNRGDVFSIRSFGGKNLARARLEASMYLRSRSCFSAAQGPTSPTISPSIKLLKVKKEGRAMHGQIGSDGSESEVIRFARAERTSPSDDADQLDKAGQTILQMGHRAAGATASASANGRANSSTPLPR